MTSKSFYQVSDVVTADVITSCTNECTRDDCRVSAKKLGSTMLGNSNHYDKAGRLHVTDPNAMTVDVCCWTCDRGWSVKRGLNGDNSIVEAAQ